MPNFLDIKDLSSSDIKEIINCSLSWKVNRYSELLKNKNVLMIFEKPSLRTRISFEVCINDLGGKCLILNSNEFKFGERESVYDTAKVLERYIDLIIIRSYEHSILKKFVNYFSKPVINALTDHSHPCQVLADLVTLKEKFGNLEGKKISWFGDFNNVTQSWLEAAALLNIDFHLSLPKDVFPEKETMDWVKDISGRVFVSNDPKKVANKSDCIITDTWISMGEDKKKSIKKFQPYQVNQSLMSLAKPDAVFMHCLPAYRGFEVTNDVINSNKSVVFDQAENRIHAQKSILDFCFKL